LLVGVGANKPAFVWNLTDERAVGLVHLSCPRRCPWTAQAISRIFRDEGTENGADDPQRDPVAAPLCGAYLAGFVEEHGGRLPAIRLAHPTVREWSDT